MIFHSSRFTSPIPNCYNEGPLSLLTDNTQTNEKEKENNENNNGGEKENEEVQEQNIEDGLLSPS